MSQEARSYFLDIPHRGAHEQFVSQDSSQGTTVRFIRPESGFTKFRFQAMTQYPAKSDRSDAG